MLEPKRDAHTTDPWEARVLPYVLGELAPDERRAFESTMEDSPLCRMRVYETRQLVQRLRDTPRERAPAALHDRILASVAAEESEAAKRRRSISLPWPAVLKAAACVAVVIGGVRAAEYWLAIRDMGATAAARPAVSDAERAIVEGLDWLARVQEPSGAWDGATWGGGPQYTTGLTGLALLALASGQPDRIEERYETEMRRAVQFLLSRQRGDGVFAGPGRGMRFDHAIATCALLAVYEKQPDAGLKRRLDAALGPLREKAHRLGGLGPGHRFEEASASPAAAWAALALERAASLGWSEWQTAGEAGLDALGPAWPAGSEARAETIDYYRLYLLSTGLASTPRKEAGPLLAELQARIISSQEKEGPMAGSWKRAGRFSAAGGRIYSTSLATLMLRADSSRT